jgi:extracellular elastinolytic metalloproteinase
VTRSCRCLDQIPLSQNESGGMGEGWSDFFALTFNNVLRPNDKLVLGDRVKNNPRGFPYDNAFADGFDAVGTADTSVRTRSAKSGAPP